MRSFFFFLLLGRDAGGREGNHGLLALSGRGGRHHAHSGVAVVPGVRGLRGSPGGGKARFHAVEVTARTCRG